MAEDHYLYGRRRDLYPCRRCERLVHGLWGDRIDLERRPGNCRRQQPRTVSRSTVRGVAGLPLRARRDFIELFDGQGKEVVQTARGKR